MFSQRVGSKQQLPCLHILCHHHSSALACQHTCMMWSFLLHQIIDHAVLLSTQNVPTICSISTRHLHSRSSAVIKVGVKNRKKIAGMRHLLPCATTTKPTASRCNLHTEPCMHHFAVEQYCMIKNTHLVLCVRTHQNSNIIWT